MILLSHVLGVSALLFSIGVIGVLCRRNTLVVFMSVEIMLNAANLAFIGFARERGGMEGQAIAFFVMALAAAEVAVGLGIIMAVFKKQGTIDLGKVNFLKG